MGFSTRMDLRWEVQSLLVLEVRNGRGMSIRSFRFRGGGFDGSDCGWEIGCRG